MGTSPPLIAGCFALSAFTVAITAGLASDNPPAQILLRAIVVMFMCYPMGFAVGWLSQRVVADHLTQRHESNASADVDPAPAPVAGPRAPDGLAMAV